MYGGEAYDVIVHPLKLLLSVIVFRLVQFCGLLLTFEMQRLLSKNQFQLLNPANKILSREQAISINPERGEKLCRHLTSMS